MGVDRSICYVLDSERRPVPCADFLAWGQWMATTDRAVARSAGNGWELKTSFIGCDLNYRWEGDPVTFESLSEIGERVTVLERYRTWAEAEKGHAEHAADLLRTHGPAAS